MDLIKIGQFVASKRQEQSMTQMQLAETLHVTPQAVSMWERGRRFPDAQYILELCRALRTNPIELLKGREMSDRALKDRIDDYIVDHCQPGQLFTYADEHDSAQTVSIFDCYIESAAEGGYSIIPFQSYEGKISDFGFR